ncbi:beta-1,6-N-acetylglucosaminyltransferase [Furfurilactobacillus sp. WILCCON 0119]
MDLIKAATKQGHYSFYHLLSGLDLPLANQDYIHTFFDQHIGENFLTYSAQVAQSDLEVRMMKHHLSKHYRDRRVFYRMFNKIEGKFLKLAANRHPSKIKHEIEFGSNWFSISHDLATAVVQSEQWITSTFSHGFLVDELFIPAVINHASANFKIYHAEKVHDKPDELQGNLRYINWWDGSPYTWRSQDLSKLKAAKEMGHLFARKFDSSVDKEIITMVIDQLVKDPIDNNND